MLAVRAGWNYHYEPDPCPARARREEFSAVFSAVFGVTIGMRTKLFAALALTAAVVVGAPAQAQQSGDAERGYVLSDTCMGCHGIRGHRNAFPTFRVPKLGGQHERALYLALVGYAERNRSHPTMYAQSATLTDQDKLDIAAWFASLGEPRSGREDRGPRVERGREKAATCAACHGQDGISPNPEWPSLAGQHESYLLHTLRQYQNGEREDPVMAGLVANLSDEDLRDLSAFYAAQPGLFTTRARDVR